MSTDTPRRPTGLTSRPTGIPRMSKGTTSIPKGQQGHPSGSTEANKANTAIISEEYSCLNHSGRKHIPVLYL
eukprot:2916696-Heterocapsa_arctica.AAC.1